MPSTSLRDWIIPLMTYRPRFNYLGPVQCMDRNLDTYSLREVAAGYARESHLQLPEESILRLILPKLPTARMLDLGVGGGRTTLHFAKWIREYVGADYSPSMILECQRRFSGYPNHISFRVCDARSMEIFET